MSYYAYLEPPQPIEVISSPAGDTALAVLAYEGVRAHAITKVIIDFETRNEPKVEATRLGVVLDRIDYDSLRNFVSEQHLDLHSFLQDFALLVVAQYVTSHGLPPATPSGESAFLIPGGNLANMYLHQQHHRQAPSDEAILEYITRKIFWSWRHGLLRVAFSNMDARLLSVSRGELDRVAIAGEGKYWTVQAGDQPRYSPTGRLIQDFEAGILPGIRRPPLMVALEALSAPRYASVREHLSKAVH